MRLTGLLGLVFALAAAQGALACSEPAPPTLPEPHLAAPADMLLAQREVEHYLAAQEAYLACVHDPGRHNAIVDRMHALAKRFNQVVRAYKARQTNQAGGSWLASLDAVPASQ
ncbi:MAG: hypothetical protein RBS22_10805 [Spongiibacteraceae bacterium]|jgi:hypothetical protein|nr:hypothetical protein [Spongiibacteraceae bacterium]